MRPTALIAQNEQGGGLGEIENLMIDLTSGRVAYAILEVGGWISGISTLPRRGRPCRCSLAHRW
jgi:hypothetical protein